jgi:uncharacterized protein
MVHADFQVPKLTSIVMDQAGMIDRPAQKKIEEIALRLKQADVAQLAVLTVDSLDGESIEEASMKVADQWQLGSAQKDHGVLLMVARKERKIRIEVGQGLEGDLTDVQSSRIIREQMLPLFQQSEFSKGIFLGVLSIGAQLMPDLFEKETALPPKKRMNLFFPITLFMLGIFLNFVNRVRGARGLRRGSIMYPGGFSSRSSGGFGGGWSGGGGGFSGGGASGGW